MAADQFNCISMKYLLGRKGLILAYHFRSQAITKGSQGRNLRQACLL